MPILWNINIVVKMSPTSPVRTHEDRMSIWNVQFVLFLFNDNLDRSTTQPKFDPSGFQIHDLQVM